MVSIRIVKIPPGFAPLEIRGQWFGVEIPLATLENIREDPPSKTDIDPENEGGYLVLRIRAIEALRMAGRTGAVKFLENLPLRNYLVFGENVCELVR